MSLWYFLSDWFGAVPTHGTLFKRSMINVAWAIAMLFVMMFLGVTGEYAVLVIFAVFAVNGVMSFVFLRQRERARD